MEDVSCLLPSADRPLGSRSASARSARARRAATIAACLVLCAVILALELRASLDVAAGTIYWIVILATIWARDAWVTLSFVALCTVLVSVGWMFSEPAGAQWDGTGNRILAMGSVALCGALVVSRLAANARFRVAVETAPAGMLVVNKRNEIVLANEEVGRIFGQRPDELCGLHLGRLLTSGENGWPGVEKHLGSKEETLLGHRDEVRGIGADGSLLPVEVRIRDLRTELGSLTLVTIRDLTQERLREERDERLASIVRSSRDAILAKDLSGHITDWNPGAEAMYGYTAREVVGHHIAILVPHGRREELELILERVRRGETVKDLRTRRVTKDGRKIDVDLSVSPIRDRHGRIVGASAIARDITVQCESERLLHELNTALSHAMPGIARVDADGRVAEANVAFRGLLERKADDLRGLPWHELVGRQDPERARHAFETMLRDGHAELTVSVSSERFLELFLVRRLDTQARFVGFHLFMRDVTERAREQAEVREHAERLEEVNEKLQREAHVDALTGLLNRRGLERHLRRLEMDTRRGGSGAAVLLIDVDDFKAINSAYGHAGGDRVLAKIAQRLDETARVADMTARIGGDEFLVLLPGTPLGLARQVAERLRTALSGRPISTSSGEVEVTCSVGVTELPTVSATIERILESLRPALARSKREGKNRVSTVEPREVRATPLDELLEGHGLRAFHQPIYDFLENRVVAYELLTRGPEGPNRSPQAFFGLVNPGESLVRLDLQCLRVCAEEAVQLPPQTSLHFNLFPRTLMDVGAERIVEILEESGVASRSCIELNEHELPGDSPELRDNVLRLRRSGIQVAIDDVGFGSSSLEALIHLEPDVVKVDRSCLRESDAHSDRALERLLNVASVLRARVVVEGVEDETTLERLMRLHVRFGQGFLWGEPRPTGGNEVLWPQARECASGRGRGGTRRRGEAGGAGRSRAPSSPGRS